MNTDALPFLSRVRISPATKKLTGPISFCPYPNTRWAQNLQQKEQQNRNYKSLINANIIPRSNKPNNHSVALILYTGLRWLCVCLNVSTNSFSLYVHVGMCVFCKGMSVWASVSECVYVQYKVYVCVSKCVFPHLVKVPPGAPSCSTGCNRDNVRVKSAVTMHRWDLSLSHSLPPSLSLCPTLFLSHSAPNAPFFLAVHMYQIWHAHSLSARTEQPGTTFQSHPHPWKVICVSAECVGGQSNRGREREILTVSESHGEK